MCSLSFSILNESVILCFLTMSLHMQDRKVYAKY